MNTTLLIGEDEPHLAEIMVYVAKKMAITYHAENNGLDVLNTARDLHPDILLLDIYMPKINGIQVCKELKMDPTTNQMFIIMITASAKLEDEHDAMKAGANEFIKKPFSPKSLHDRLSMIIREDKNKWLNSLVENTAV